MGIKTMLSKIKKSVSEPKVFALMVESAHGQVLHLGVHFTLEEAYSAARRRMESLSSHTPGEAMDIDLWNMIPARQIIAQLLDPLAFNEPSTPKEKEEESPDSPNNPISIPHEEIGDISQFPTMLRNLLTDGSNMVPSASADSTVSDYIQGVKEKKNGLMKKLITDGDVEQVEKLKELLGPSSRKYVLQAIKRKNLK